MKNENRFIRAYEQGSIEKIQIWVDRETGVNYLFQVFGYAGGITPLLDENGKPVITPKEKLFQNITMKLKNKKDQALPV